MSKASSMLDNLLFSGVFAPKNLFQFFLSLMFISFTMLNTAAKGHKECVELLLNNKASLNGKDKVTFVHAVNLLIRTS